MKTLYKNIALFVGGSLWLGGRQAARQQGRKERLHPRSRSCPAHEGLRYEHR